MSYQDILIQNLGREAHYLSKNHSSKIPGVRMAVVKGSRNVHIENLYNCLTSLALPTALSEIAP